MYAPLYQTSQQEEGLLRKAQNSTTEQPSYNVPIRAKNGLADQSKGLTEQGKNKRAANAPLASLVILHRSGEFLLT